MFVRKRRGGERKDKRGREAKRKGKQRPDKPQEVK